MRRPIQIAVCVAILIAASPAMKAAAQQGFAETPPQEQPLRGGGWRAGKYLFTDDAGGFSITSIRGDGSRLNPVIITQDIRSIGPSVLTVRSLDAVANVFDIGSTWTTLHLQLETANMSMAGWTGYRLELQKQKGEPSLYGDGLSFNQMTRDESAILSDRFQQYEVEYEPGDRLVFSQGSLEPREVARFSVFLLDLSPTGQFFIEQQPQLPVW